MSPIHFSLTKRKFFKCQNMHFLRVQTWIFLLCLWSNKFLQNIRMFYSIATANKLKNLAQSLFFMYKLLLNHILLICSTSDQKLFWATLRSPITEAIILFIQKRPRTDAHSNYSVRYTCVFFLVEIISK